MWGTPGHAAAPTNQRSAALDTAAESLTDAHTRGTMVGMAHVLVIDDEPGIRSLLRRGLEAEGHTVDEAADGASGLTQALVSSVELVVLDLGLPDVGGEVVLAQLRRVRPWVPVIVLTARDDVASRVTALDQGAEDYVIKPFDLAELMARVRLRLRRATAYGDATQPEAPTTLHRGRISLDRLRRAASVSGESVVLTPQEYAVLEELMLHAEVVVSRSQLLRSVWGLEQAPRRSNLVDVAVASLRRRIGASAIETVRGEGYRFLG